MGKKLRHWSPSSTLFDSIYMVDSSATISHSNNSSACVISLAFLLLKKSSIAVTLEEISSLMLKKRVLKSITLVAIMIPATYELSLEWTPYLAKFKVFLVKLLHQNLK